MTCIIAYSNGESSFIAGDKLGSNGFTKSVMVEPKIFEKKFIKVLSDGVQREEQTIAMGGTTSFRMLQLLDHKLVLPVQEKDTTTIQYLVHQVIPEIRLLFKEEWGSRDNTQEVGGGQFIILHNHVIYEVQEDFSVLQPKTNITSVGSGTYHAIASMQAFLIAEKDSKVKLIDRVTDVFEIVSANVTSVSAEYDIFKY
ncbi:hypothetical protein AAGG91_002900 [Salmonella enterica]|nr:hypothetical protein [Salmonella enterica]MCP0435834.1 hypothetical protein [Salmonella enterica subsp. enterica serovar Mbandaka]